MSEWTRAAVEALAPDSSSLSAGLGLAKPRAWQTLGREANAIWGEIKGSGSSPYQARVDLSQPAFKCTCPSRKFPCKHALGLMFILAAEPSALTAAPPPGWVADWLSNRDARAERKTVKSEATTGPDLEAQAKRIKAREAKVEQGLKELDTWLLDIVRVGLSKARNETGFAQNIAARLVDAQAPGLAREVNAIAGLSASGPAWERRVVAALGRLHLLSRAYRQQAQLPAELRADVRQAIGWTVPTEEVLKQTPVSDAWLILAHRIEHDAQVSTRRTWVYGGHSKRFALLLAFAAGSQPLPPIAPVGQTLIGELCFYPSAAPLRASWAQPPETISHPAPLPTVANFDAAFAVYADTLTRVPWLAHWPMAVASLRFVSASGAPWLVDAQGASVPLRGGFAHEWAWRAVTGDVAADVFGEWDGEVFHPLALNFAGSTFELSTLDGIPVLARMASYATAR
jgi:hypothetical protein